MRTSQLGKTYLLKDELEALETRLRSTLQPVIPNPEFVSDLYHRLYSIESRPFIRGLPKSVQSLLLVVGVLLGGIVMLFTGIRAIVSLVGLFGLLTQYFKRQTRRSQQAAISNSVS